ncbi:MAG: alpha/beta hydrolase [Clostridia bacterium]|nr:alpha/beta hydrolase [Clostridia bacterium]
MWIIYTVLSVAVFFLIICLVIGIIGFKMACTPQRVKKPETDPKRILRGEIRKKNNAYMLSHPHEDVELKTPDGITLTARYIPAEKETKKFVICIHGYNCNGPDEMSHLFPFYHYDMGYNYFLPDLRGHGRSSGNIIGFGALDYKDINRWIDWLTDRFGNDIEIMIHGISMGAATSMLVNNNNPAPQVKLIIEDCGYTNAFRQVGIKTRLTVRFLKTDFIVYFINFFCRIFAGYDLKKDADPLGTMKNAKNPVLFIHGELDQLVPFPMCLELYEACPVEKDIFTVPEAVHAYSYYDAKDEYDRKMREFIAKHFDSSVAVNN